MALPSNHRPGAYITGFDPPEQKETKLPLGQRHNSSS
jgi:hypothetical protein